MAYKYRSRRSTRRLARRSQKNFIITLIIIGILIYATINWILPYFIGSLGFISNTINPPQKAVLQTSQKSALAPPVLNIPYEATNSGQISITGFTTPNSSVKLYIDDEPDKIVDSQSDGSFIFENIDLRLGTNNIYGKTLDDSGKESLPSKTIKLIYDNEKPSLEINEPEDNKNIQGGDQKVRVSGQTEPGVKIFINGNQVIVGIEGNFSTELSLDEGNNIISIKAIDMASNATEIQRMVTYSSQETQ